MMQRSPLAGTQFLEERDSKIRHLIGSFCFNHQYLRRCIERREPTIAILLQLHARKSASMMPRMNLSQPIHNAGNLITLCRRAVYGKTR
ncbi:hypothetical protein [Ignatzschineria cameli]|uniref:hypothetical protein n=1 Tax=Ignatzschineria cameli TaxID=2182793 RepID=UPI001057B191|nr:hypothetical protein [Ignatzschineria cameli]